MNIRAKDGCRWGLVSLGAAMLRLDPGDLRASTPRGTFAFGRAAANTTSRAAPAKRSA